MPPGQEPDYLRTKNLKISGNRSSWLDLILLDGKSKRFARSRKMARFACEYSTL
jgi:hypothetical protein